MKDILNTIIEWEAAGKEFCIATVVNTWRSSPRPVGSSMIISTSGEMAGSVSGGCVEKVVVETSREVFENNKPILLNYGVQDEDAWNVGLSCGGKIEVLLEKFPSFLPGEEKQLWNDLYKCISSNKPVAWISHLDNQVSKHHFVEPDKLNDDSITKEAFSLLNLGKSELIEVENKRYFVQVFPSKMRLIMIGSAHITSELLQLAMIHDFKTIVIDPRDTFASKTHLPVKPDQLFISWPQEILEQLHPGKDTYVVILSHDPKIDDAALEILLRKKVDYIGALGSKRTHEKRRSRLKEKGFSDDELDQISGPVGLDINATTAREIALSIMAEIISVKNSQAE